MGTITCSLLAAALFVSACKKSEEQKDQEKFQKAQENVNRREKEAAREAKDVKKEATELSKSEQQMIAAAADYRRVLQARLEKLDSEIKMLEQSAEAKSQEKAAKLRIKYNEL